VIDADRITRGIPTFRPSFLMLTLRVSAAWIQQVNVPNPKVKDVPTLWISSSFVSYGQIMTYGSPFRKEDVQCEGEKIGKETAKF
jgi:hypothetical protein